MSQLLSFAPPPLGALGSGIISAGAGALLLDTFTGTDGDDPDVSKWTYIDGQFEIRGNALRPLVAPLAAAGRFISLVDNPGNGIVEVKLLPHRTTGPTTIYIYVRQVSDSVHYRLTMTINPTGGSTFGVGFEKNGANAGGGTTIVSPATNTDGVTVTLQVVGDGVCTGTFKNTLTDATLTGSPTVTTSTGGPASGKVGFHAASNPGNITSGIIDQFKLSAP